MRIWLATFALLTTPAAAAAGATGWRPGSFDVHGVTPVRVSVASSDGYPAYVAHIDTSKTRLVLYPSGEVPPSQRGGLLATFNGGFKPTDGGGGLVVRGKVLAPMEIGMGTLVEYRNGSIDIVDWGRRMHTRALAFARQNLPPLVWDGKPTGRTVANWLWGATLGHVSRTWRTALGIDRSGNLVYAAADGQTAASLASLMARLGAVRAIELDINPEWPSFIGYLSPGGRNPLKVVPNSQEPTLRYLVPDSRDFFAVYVRR